MGSEIIVNAIFQTLKRTFLLYQIFLRINILCLFLKEVAQKYKINSIYQKNKPLLDL